MSNPPSPFRHIRDPKTGEVTIVYDAPPAKAGVSVISDQAASLIAWIFRDAPHG